MSDADASEDASFAETTTVAAEAETTLEVAMKNIFSACDTENTGSVLASKLIDYITPFIQYNMFELMQLKQMLDPESKNVCIEEETFYAVMSDWSRRVSAANNDECFRETIPRDFEAIEEKDLPFVQSTPRSSFGHHFLKGYTESGVTNVSTFSACSESDPDKSFFEEQVRELVHQNKKLQEELIQAKVQLTASEEQIESLQANFDRVAQRLASEQQANELLQKNVKEADDARESSTVSLSQHEDLKKQKLALEKDYLSLKEELSEVDNARIDLLQHIEGYSKREHELKQKLLELNKEIELREGEISSMEDINSRLKSEIEEHQRIGEDYKKRSEELLAEKQSLEKLLHKQLQNNLSTSLNRSHHSSGSYCSPGNFLHCTSFPEVPPAPIFPLKNSPFEKIRQQCTVFNSPRLLRQLINPLSPLAPNSSICEDSPEMIRHPAKSSTPITLTQVLDDSIPASIKNLPVLCPTTWKNEISRSTSKGAAQGENQGSPPVMYVIERSAESPKAQQRILHNNSEEDYWKVNVEPILEKQSPHNSLLAEISEVNVNCMGGKDCPHFVQLMERSSALLSLQYELVEHENCSYIIDKQKMDIEKLKQQQEDYVQKMELLSFQINELNCRLAANNAGDAPNTSTTYVTEVKLNLEQEAGDAGSIKIALEHLQKEKQTLLAQVKALEHDKASVLVSYQGKVIHLKDELQEASKRYGEIKTKLEELLSENCLLKENIHALENSVRTLSGVKIETEKERDQLKEANEKFKAEMSEVKRRLEGLISAYEQLKEKTERDKAKALESTTQLESRMREMETELCRKDEAICALKKNICSEIDLRTQQQQKYEQALTFKNDEIEYLSGSFKDQKEINNNLIRNLQLLENEINNKNNVISDMQEMKKTELEHYSQNMSALRELNSKLQSDIEKKEKELRALDSRYIEVKTANENIHEELKRLQEEYKMYKDFYCVAMKENAATESMTETECEILRAELAQIKKEKEEAESKLLAMEAEKLLLVQQNETEASLVKRLHSKSISARFAIEELERKKSVYLPEQEKIQQLKKEHEELVAENAGLKEKLVLLGVEFTEQSQKREEEKTESDSQNEELLNRISETLFEVSQLQRLHKNETSLEVPNASASYSALDDSSRKDRKEKEKLSFSKMQIKADRLQEKMENLQELLMKEKRRNKELQSQIAKNHELEIDMRREIEELKQKGVEVEMRKMLESAESEIFCLKAKLDGQPQGAFDLKEIEIIVLNTVSEINGVRSVLHESNVGLVSLLEELPRSAERQVQRPQDALLSSWCIHTKKNPLHQNTSLPHLESGEPAAKTLKTWIETLGEQIAGLKDTAFFNKQFSELLKTFVQETNYGVSDNEVPTQSFTLDQGSVHKRFSLRPATLLLRPVSPDSPSLIDFPLVETGAKILSQKSDGCSWDTSSNSSISPGSHSVSSNKEDDVHSVHSSVSEETCAFPNLPDALLESLTDLQDISWDGSSGRETLEEKYGILMTAFATDDSSIRLRLESQRAQVEESKRRFLADLRMLRGSRAKTQMPDITEAFSRVCAFAEMFGAMREERKVHRCLQLIRSYVSVLHQELEGPVQYRFTRVTARPLHKKLNFSCQKQLKIVVRKRYDCGVKAASPPTRKNDIESCVKQESGEESRLCERPAEKTAERTGKGIWFWLFCGICVLVLVTIFGNVFTEIAFSGKDMRRSFYPLKDLSWDELLVPVSKKIYCHKECPH